MKPFFLSAILLFLLGGVHAGATTTVLGKDWALQWPGPTGENLRSIAQNGTLVASTDSNNVTTYSISPATSLVAVGGNGAILTAAGVKDTDAWSKNTVPSTAGDLWDVAYTGGTLKQYIAVGSLGTILVATDTLATTPTGLTWAAVATPVNTTDQYNAVTTNGSVWAVVGATSTGAGVCVVTTNGGSTWTRRLVSNATSLKDVTFVGSNLYAVMDGAVLRSSDNGVSWVTGSLPSTIVKSIAYAIPAGQEAVLNVTGAATTAASSATSSWTGIGSASILHTNYAAANLSVQWSINALVGVTRSGQLWQSTSGVDWQNVSNNVNIAFNRAIKYDANT